MPRIYLSPPDIRSQDHLSVDAVLASNWVAPVGPHLSKFEASVSERVGRKHAVALNSGTAALHLALQVLGVGAGDQVICPTLTFAASANPICYLGAEPVFIDSESRTWNMDPDLLEDALCTCSSVKAVVVVHLYGQCAEMDRILEICRRYEVPVIEDAAEALGASYKGKPAGSMGDLSFFSFNGNKIITTSGGGMLLSDNEQWIKRAIYLATQAREPVSHYEHKEIGYNYRLSNVLAGLGLSQLEDLQRRIDMRRGHFEAYRDAFRGFENITFMPIVDAEETNYWLTCLLLEPEGRGIDRDSLIAALEVVGIESRPLWKPLHLQPVFSKCRVFGGACARALFTNGVCLPSGSGMTIEQRNKVIGAVHSFYADTQN